MSGARGTQHLVVLAALREFMAKHKESPTLGQLSAATGFGMGSVNFYMTQLREKGLIYRAKNSRVIELVGAAKFMRFVIPQGKR